jgi:hypothetical protein
MNEEEMKALISNLIKDELQNQLLQVGAAKSYGGIPKPTNSRFPGSIGNKISSGELYNSIQVDFGTDFNNGGLQLEVSMAEYGKYVDEGRLPGVEIQKSRTSKTGKQITYKSYTKFPPLTEIKSWVQQKPALTAPNLTTDQRAFLAARSIARDGIFPTNFIDKAIKNVEDKVIYYLGEYAAEYLENLIATGQLKVNQVSYKR